MGRPSWVRFPPAWVKMRPMDAARPILITGPRAELLAGQLGPAAASLSIQRVASPEEILLRAQDSQCVLVVIDGGQAASTAVLCEELSRLEIPSLVLSDDSAVAARLAAAGARAILPSTSPLGPTVQRLLVEQHASESRATAVRDLQRAASLLRDQICSMEQRERDQAHEIRTPVGIIRLFAHNLKDGLDGELTELQAESVDAIMRAAEQLVDLVSTPMGGSPVPDYIESLLERRPEQRRTKRTQVDFNEFASGVVALFSVEAARAGHRLELELQPDLPRPWLDRSQITQVLSNLLSNAIKFTPSGGRIVVSAREETPSKGPSSRRLGGEVRLSVTDDGPGIPEADLERIF
jgi:signal transduction histidine kinase